MLPTAIPVTEETILAAFLDYNDAYLEEWERELAATGMPLVRVRCYSQGGTGRTIRAQIQAGIRITDPAGLVPENQGFPPQGWFYQAHEAIFFTMNRLDGRLSPVENVKKLIWRKDPDKAMLRVTDVDVVWVDG